MENLAVKKIKTMIGAKKIELANKKTEENRLLAEKIRLYDELIELETNIKYKEDIAISFEVHHKLDRLAKIFGVTIFVLESLVFNCCVFTQFNSILLYLLGNSALALISYVCYRTVISENLKNIKNHDLDVINLELTKLRVEQEEVERRLSLNEREMKTVLDAEANIRESIKGREEALYQISNYLVDPIEEINSVSLESTPIRLRAKE